MTIIIIIDPDPKVNYYWCYCGPGNDPDVNDIGRTLDIDGIG